MGMLYDSVFIYFNDTQKRTFFVLHVFLGVE